MEVEEQRLELIEELLSCGSVDEMAMQEAVAVLLRLSQDATKPAHLAQVQYNAALHKLFAACFLDWFVAIPASIDAANEGMWDLEHHMLRKCPLTADIQALST